MKEKKPVYNGYDEKYLTGAELKKFFPNQYFGTGRHHGTILDITIEEYLEFMPIEDGKTYRIFVNNYFCRVMKEDTDGLICFFSHSPFEHVKLTQPPSDARPEKICPDCGAVMQFKKGRYGEFLGCSNFPTCKHTKHIPFIGNYQDPALREYLIKKQNKP